MHTVWRTLKDIEGSIHFLYTSSRHVMSKWACWIVAVHYVDCSKWACWIVAVHYVDCSKWACWIVAVHYVDCSQLNWNSDVCSYYCSLHGESSLTAVKGKANPLHTWKRPDGSWRLRVPNFKTISTSSYKPPWSHPDLCTLQLSPLYHRDEGIEEGSRNKYFCMV